MPSRNTIEIVIQGEDKASKVIGQINTSLDTLGKFALGAVIGGVTTAISSVVGFSTKAILEFAEFEKGMAETFKLLPDLSKEAMLQMEDDVQRLAARYGQLPTDVAAGMASAIGAGVDVSQINAFMNTAAQAAVAGSTDMQTAVDGLTSVVNAYGAEVIDAARASDIMFKTVDLGKVEFSELSRYLFNVIPTAASLGLAFEDVGAAISLLTAQGTPASVATTQIRQLLVELQKPTTEVSKLFEQMAGVSFPEFIKQGGNLSEALDMIRKGADDSGMELAAVFGSVEALNAFLGLSGPNAEKYAGFIAEMGDSAGSTARAFEVMQKTISFQSARVQAKLSNLFINVGRKFEPFAAKVVETIGDVVSVFDNFFSTDFSEGGDFTGLAKVFYDLLKPIKPIFDTLTHLVSSFFAAFEAGIPFMDNVRVHINAFLAEFAPNLLDPVNQFIDTISMIGQEIGRVLEPIAKWVSENVKLSDVLTVIGIAIASVVLPAIASLVAAIVSFAAPIVALIGAVALLRTAWENDFGGIRTFITNEVLPALQQLAEWFLTTALPAIVNFIQTEAIPAIQTFVDDLVAIWDTIRPGLESLYNWFVNEGLPAVVDFIQNTVMPHIQAFVDILEGIWIVVQIGLLALQDWFTTSGMPAIDTATGVVRTSIELFQTLLKELWDIVKPFLEPIVNWFRDTFSAIGERYIQPVIDFINDIIQKAKDAIEILRQIGGGAPNTVNVPGGVSFGANAGIQGFASGTEYVDRDRIVKVHRGEAILTAEENEARMKGNSGNTNNISINLMGSYKNQSEANRDADMLVNALRLKGVDLSRA